jgi:tRNA (guanine-N7-)-methyltransferase
LGIYSKLLATDGELIFKTDNMPLYEFTLEELTTAGWQILTSTKDWHSDLSRDSGEPMTEYEGKFAALGQNIGRITARHNMSSIKK